MISNSSILFPNLGITLKSVGRYIDLPFISIAYYGIVIAIGMVLGVSLIQYLAKKSGQSEEMYFNLCCVVLILSVLGARAYYVVFAWKEYRSNPLEILNIREGGLAIYGGILTGILVILIFSYRKKYAFGRILDTMMPGVIIGQILGRWGNFFNREAFGEYTDGIFAMALPKDAVYASDITEKMLEHVKMIDGISFIQVHPTFLYEMIWNSILLVVLLFLWKRKKYDGQIALVYFLGYGAGRFWIESLRTDQLLIMGSKIPVSMVVSAVMVIVSIIIMRTKTNMKTLV